MIFLCMVYWYSTPTPSYFSFTCRRHDDNGNDEDIDLDQLLSRLIPLNSTDVQTAVASLWMDLF